MQGHEALGAMVFKDARVLGSLGHIEGQLILAAARVDQAVGDRVVDNAKVVAFNGDAGECCVVAYIAVIGRRNFDRSELASVCVLRQRLAKKAQ